VNLFRKYVIVFVALVSVTLVASGAVQSYFAYQEKRDAIIDLQAAKAALAALEISQFVGETERQITSAVPLPGLAASLTADDRRSDFNRLLRQADAITSVSYLDASGREQLKVSKLALSSLASGVDSSSDPAFVGTRAGASYFGPVFFRNESEPYMIIAVPDRGGGALPGKGQGVTVAEVKLKFLRDIVLDTQGEASSYVVDAAGRLIAHPNLSRVLQKTDLSALPLVQEALVRRTGTGQSTGPSGNDVLAAYQRIDPPGWTVFVNVRASEAFAPLNSLLVRTGLLLLGGLALAVAAGLFLARRMVAPIRVLQAGAASLGAGALDQRIEVRTGDELEGLAEEFNQMASRLRESYAGLERTVEERTRELSESLEQQTATSDILSVIAGSPTDLQPVLDAVAERAARLLDSQDALIWLIDGDEMRLRAKHGLLPGVALEMKQPLDGGVPGSRAVLEQAVINVPDLEAAAAEWPGMARIVGMGIRTIVAVPLVREGQSLGAIAVRRMEARPFSDRQIDLLKTFADQAVIAIENVRLFHEIEEKSQELEVASRHKSEFLANMSHELRTPLNAIIGFSEVLIARMFGDLGEKQEEYLRDILDSGQHLLSLINDILDLSKVEAGRM